MVRANAGAWGMAANWFLIGLAAFAILIPLYFILK